MPSGELFLEGVFLALTGVAMVVLVLGGLMGAIYLLRGLFPADAPEAEEIPAEQDRRDDKDRPVPPEVLVAVAVEHQRRRSGSGSELLRSREYDREWFGSGDFV